MRHFIIYFTVFILTFSPYVVWGTDNSTSNQTNTSGSNTSISGGYTSTTNNTYSGGQTNSTTNTTTNSTEQSKIPVGTASAPSMSSYSQDLCTVGVGFGVQTLGLGVSGGSYFTDQNCERMKLSKLLYDYQMRVAAVAILCQDDRVFSAMENAGTPCPFEGKIGKDAKQQWKKYDKERPDYDQYTSKLKVRAQIDLQLSEEERKRVEKLKKEQQLKAIEETKRKMKELEELQNKDKKKSKSKKGNFFMRFLGIEHRESNPDVLKGSWEEDKDWADEGTSFPSE